jgi:hypothetical protein
MTRASSTMPTHSSFWFLARSKCGGLLVHLGSLMIIIAHMTPACWCRRSAAKVTLNLYGAKCSAYTATTPRAVYTNKNVQIG